MGGMEWYVSGSSTGIESHNGFKTQQGHGVVLSKNFLMQPLPHPYVLNKRNKLENDDRVH